MENLSNSGLLRVKHLEMYMQLLNDCWTSTVKALTESVGEERANQLLSPYMSNITYAFYLNLVAFDELWQMATRALVDSMRPEKALEMMTPHIIQLGKSYGSQFVEEDEDLSSLTAATNLISRCYIPSFTQPSEVGSSCDMKVHDCPFRDAPPIMCAQMRLLMQSLLDNIGLKYEFEQKRYDETEDGNCYWKLKRKEVDGKADTLESSEIVELLKPLKWRLTKGEISLQEYRELKKELLDQSSA